MSTRYISNIWHHGPPPHIGWWFTINEYSRKYWRWWDGKRWSCGVDENSTLPDVVEAANTHHMGAQYRWCDYWPDHARVPRIDPRKL